MPAEWRPGIAQAFNNVFVLGYRCNRIHFADIERGPFQIAIEFHDAFSLRQGCVDVDAARYVVISRVLVDDSGIAQELVRRLGLPAEMGSLSLESQAVAPDSVAVSWTLSREGGGRPAEGFGLSGEASDGDYSNGYKLFWFRNDLPIAWDASFAAESQAGDGLGGSFSGGDTFLVGASPVPPVARYYGEREGVLAGSLHEYRDIECTPLR